MKSTSSYVRILLLTLMAFHISCGKPPSRPQAANSNRTEARPAEASGETSGLAPASEKTSADDEGQNPYPTWTQQDWEQAVSVDSSPVVNEAGEAVTDEDQGEEDYSKLTPEVFIAAPPPVPQMSTPRQNSPVPSNDSRDEKKSEGVDVPQAGPGQILSPPRIPTTPPVVTAPSADKAPTTPAQTRAEKPVVLPTVEKPVVQVPTKPSSPAVQPPVTQPTKPAVQVPAKPRSPPVQPPAAQPAAKPSAEKIPVKPVAQPAEKPAERAEEPATANAATPQQPIDTQPPITNPATAARQIYNQAQNYVDGGSLTHATDLLALRTSLGEKSPFEIVFPSRQRFYATQDMADTLQFLGEYLRSLIPTARLLISDVARKNGGPIYSSAATQGATKAHQSHQNGLDADVAYVSKTTFDRFTSLRSSTINENVDVESQFKLFQQAANLQNLEVFFIYPALKKEFCIMGYKKGWFESGKENKSALDTLAHLMTNVAGHDSHFHIRLKCDQSKHPGCKPRNSMIKGHGCILRK